MHLAIILNILMDMKLNMIALGYSILQNVIVMRLTVDLLITIRIFFFNSDLANSIILKMVKVLLGKILNKKYLIINA
jgi:hypothetical protein